MRAIRRCTHSAYSALVDSKSDGFDQLCNTEAYAVNAPTPKQRPIFNEERNFFISPVVGLSLYHIDLYPDPLMYMPTLLKELKNFFPKISLHQQGFQI